LELLSKSYVLAFTMVYSQLTTVRKTGKLPTVFWSLHLDLFI